MAPCGLSGRPRSRQLQTRDGLAGLVFFPLRHSSLEGSRSPRMALPGLPGCHKRASGGRASLVPRTSSCQCLGQLEKPETVEIAGRGRRAGV